MLAFEVLASADSCVGIKTVLEPVTETLGNTPSIARKSYVHPRLIELAKSRDAQAEFRAHLKLPRTKRHLSRMERGLIAFLESDATAEPEPVLQAA